MTPSWDLLFGGAFLALMAAIALYAAAIPQGDRRWWGLFGLLAAVVLAAVLLPGGLARVFLIDAASFVTVALVWTRGTPEARRAARTYLFLLVMAVACLAAGLLLGGITGDEVTPAPAPPLDRLALGLLIAGFGLKLALAPFYFWLPGVAQFGGAMTAGLVISVVDIAAFNELAHLRLAAPWLFGRGSGLWLALALLSMFGGALLALGQRDLKRMLAFSTVDDMGYLLLGVVAGPGIGLSGALAGALAHAVCKVLLFGSVGVAEHGLGQNVDLESARSRGLLARYPVAGAAFIAGALGMIGVPPLVGFAGRWRLYLAGVQYGGFWLAVAMTMATGLALLYYVRAMHRVWFGPAPAGADPASALAQREPPLASAVLAVLAVAAAALGLFPGLITRWLP